MTVREIQAHLEEMYGADVSPSLISIVTDAVVDEVKAWQARPLDPVYPIVYLDCIHMKVRDGAVRVKAVYLAIGVTMSGEKEVPGLWLAQTEGAKFWLQVVTELRNRGVRDIFIACVDGLKGFPEAIEAAFPPTTVQLCIVHMVRHSLNYVSWKRRPEVAADLKRIYTSATVKEAEQRLVEFEARWDGEYLPIGQSWRRNWPRLIPFFDYPLSTYGMKTGTTEPCAYASPRSRCGVRYGDPVHLFERCPASWRRCSIHLVPLPDCSAVIAQLVGV
jgi:putative transposase